MTQVRIHGIYCVDAPLLCHLVEISIHYCTLACEHLKGVVYPVLVDCQKTIQAPFCIHYLSLDKGEILGGEMYGWEHPELWTSDVRAAFLMHFLEPGRKLQSPYGSLEIPSASVLPKRLQTIEYKSPY